jgi:DNA-binding phage protein
MRKSDILNEHVPTAAGHLAQAVEAMRDLGEQIAKATGQDKDPVYRALVAIVDRSLDLAVEELTAKLPKR